MGELYAVGAMYNDQGMISVKRLAPEDAVNGTIGIRVVRTSPAQGTAFDIAGRNVADPSSMKAAIMCAIQMVNAKRGLVQPVAE